MQAQSTILLAAVLLVGLWTAEPVGAARVLSSGGGSGAECCAKLTTAGFKSNLNVSIFILDNQPLQSIPKPDTTSNPVTVCECNTSMPDAGIQHAAAINQRGSHSQDTNTVASYEISFNKSHPYMGMPSGKKWVHYGPQNDTLGLHYWYAMEMYRATNDRWVPRSRFIEIFILDSDRPIKYPEDYYGLYVTLEHIEPDKNRLNLTKASAQDLTGGYILDNEHGKTRGPLKNESQFTMPRFGLTYIIRDPKPKYLTQPMIDWIKNYMITFEDALFSPTFTDPTTGWRNYANETSMIDYMLAEELSKNNNDGYRGSQFLYKDANEPLNFGPAWGLDDGFGTCCGFPAGNYNSLSNPAIQPQGWMFKDCENPANCVQDSVFGISQWYRRVWNDSEFRTAVAKREQELRSGPWSDASAMATLDNAVAMINDAGIRTLTKWGAVDACPREICQQWASPQTEIDDAVGFMKNWTLSRLHWFDEALAPELGGGAAPGPTVALAGR